MNRNWLKFRVKKKSKNSCFLRALSLLFFVLFFFGFGVFFLLLLRNSFFWCGHLLITLGSRCSLGERRKRRFKGLSCSRGLIPVGFWFCSFSFFSLLSKTWAYPPCKEHDTVKRTTTSFYGFCVVVGFWGAFFSRSFCFCFCFFVVFLLNAKNTTL